MKPVRIEICSPTVLFSSPDWLLYPGSYLLSYCDQLEWQFSGELYIHLLEDDSINICIGRSMSEKLRTLSALIDSRSFPREDV